MVNMAYCRFQNTYRGRTNSAASFAATMLEDVGASILARYNMEFSVDAPRHGAASSGTQG